MSVITSLTPVMIEPTAITAPVPMMTPSTVRNAARLVLAHRGQRHRLPKTGFRRKSSLPPQGVNRV
jgi:hypothetical protein